MYYDGHIHTPFCPHGTKDEFSEYIEQAIKLRFTEITFTEHAPLPIGFDDPTPEKDSGMDISRIEDYISTLRQLKKQYVEKIKLNIGLEVDYINGFEEETKHFLNQYGPHLDDSILSVHFLNKDKDYYCLDYSSEVFGKMIEHFGSIEEIYHLYYTTLKNSVTADLGKYKPKRIGHMTLIHKFQKVYPCTQNFEKSIIEILELLKKFKLQIDYNGAGITKQYCLEPYPPDWVIKQAILLGIPLVYGSDAHSAHGIGQGFKQLFNGAPLVSPTSK